MMPQVYADLCIAFVRLAAIQVRFGLVAAEIAVMGLQQMRDIPAVGDADPTPPVSAELDAATQVLKSKLLAGREAGFRNVLQVNFPDDEIKAMAEAILVAAHRVRDQPQPNLTLQVRAASSMQRHIGAQGPSVDAVPVG